VTLRLREAATARTVATTAVPRCARIAGVDDSGRVYLTVEEGSDSETTDVLMYDMRAHRWSTVAGIPTVGGGVPRITYVTDTGFAIAWDRQRWDGLWMALSSVEGDVDSSGRFTPQRQVPVGAGVWSPDRSYVADARADDVVVRPAADLEQLVVLQLPGQGPAWGANIQWASPTSVLVARLNDQMASATYRCDIRSGGCTLVDHEGYMAHGENAAGGG
jgi:hypothetical protein